MDFFHEGRRIGSLKEGVFRKRVKKSKHLFKRHDAWGIQYEAVKNLHAHHCEEIRILDEDDNIVYKIPFAEFYRSAIVEDYGDGLQCFLPRSAFSLIHR